MNSRATGWGTYLKIADALRDRLSALPPGATVPSEAVLADEYRVARNTVRRALARLEDESRVETVPGRGRVVRDPNRPAGTKDTAAPAYRRIADDLRTAIVTKAIAPGERVPSEADLMRQYGVSRGTARQALTLLEAAGLVHAIHGKGRFAHQEGTDQGR